MAPVQARSGSAVVGVSSPGTGDPEDGEPMLFSDAVPRYADRPTSRRNFSGQNNPKRTSAPDTPAASIPLTESLDDRNVADVVSSIPKAGAGQPNGAGGTTPHERSVHNCKTKHGRELQKPDNGNVRLGKELGLAHAVSVAMGIMIGCTIFITPASVTAHCGSIGLSLLVWAAACLIMLLQAVCFTELAVLFPKAGGMYAYLRAILGDLPAFLYAWYFCLVCQPAFMAFTAMMISSYLLMPAFRDCPLPASAVSIINIWIIVTLVFINSAYMKFVTRLQTFLTGLKFLALVAIVIVGVIQLTKGKTAILQKGFHGSKFDIGALAIAIYTCMTNYAGWEFLLMLTEEVRHPGKTIPRAIYLSFAAVGSVFFLTNVAYFTVLSPEDMMKSETVAATFAEKTMGQFSYAVPVVVALSAVGALNAVVMGGSRVHFAAARNNLFPAFLAMISIKYRTPLPAVWMTCVLSSLWSLWGDPVSVIEYLGFTDLLFIGLTTLSLISLKIRNPTLQATFKVPLALPVLSLAVLVSLATIGLVRYPVRNGIGLLPIAAGLPAYAILRARTERLRAGAPNSFDKFTFFVQKLLLVVNEEE